MKTKSLLVLGAIIIMHLSVKAQVKIGTNPTSINSNSLLELESGTQGFVLPRVSIGDVSAASPLTSTMITGTIVYNTNSTTTGGSGTGIYLWDGTKWVFISTGTAVSSSAWLLTGNSGLSSSTNFIGTTDAIDFVVKTANTERMRILGAVNGSSKAGWIGMGVTIPRSSLDVAGDYTNKNVITIQNTSSTGFSSIDMLNNSGSLVGTFGYANSGTGGNFASKTYFNSYANDFFLTRGSSYDFVMKGSNGYIGLNTATPSERLHVVGNIYLNGAFMPGGNAGTLGYVLTSAGVGVSPTWKRLDSLSWSLTGNGGTNYLTNFLGTTDNVSMRFRTNNVQRMIIDSLGRVGIGLTNPAYALSVLSASNPLYLSGVQATTTFAADSILTINGGIVKKTPYSTLNNVSWNLLGNSGTNSSINFLGTTDNHPLKFKVNNTIAGFIDSSGGLGNTYFGSNAGYSNTTGSGNTLTGSGADSANSTGTSNTALGYQAGYNNTSGGSNTFTGYQSGYSNTTASGNLFSGFQAGYKNTTGQLNMFSGYWTGYSNTTGSNNVFTGYLSGFGNTTGGNNIFIGSQAGSTNTTGSRNTLIGGNSNVLTAGLFNAAAIGYSAKVGLSNSLVLGDTISGGNAVNVGIGVRYPLKRLHIDAAPISIFATGTQDSLKIDNLASSSSAYNKAILVIDSATGYVSKQNLSNLSSNINWSLTGNSGTNYATNFLGTTDSVSMRFRTANTQRMIIDSLGHVGIGSSNFDPFNPGKLLVDYGVTSSNTMANFKGSVDDYFQINLKNNSNGGNASTDYVATADDGTDSTYYVDMGINSSNYSFSADNWGQAHDAYLYSNSKNLYIGTQANNSDVIFLVGGGRAVTNAALRIRGNTGNVVVGKGDVSTTPVGNVLRGPNGLGRNIAGGSLTIQGGAGTGTAAAGNLLLNAGITGTGANGIINFSTSSAERMRIDALGNVGIGTTNPSNPLSVIASSDPLYLSGVQPTSTFSSDSILTINAGIVKASPYSSLSAAGNWSLTGNSSTTAGTNFIGTTDAVDFVTKTNGTERMRVLANGRVGIGVTNPNYPLAVKDTMEIRRVGSLSALLFTNTAGTGDFRIAGDGGDMFWQGGGGRGLQMGSYWTTILGGDRQTTAFPAFVNAPTNTGVLVQGQRDGSVPLGIQANSLTQSANLTEWRSSSSTVLSAVNKSGYLGIGTSSPAYSLSVLSASNPLYLSGVQATSTFTTDSILTINAGVVKKAAYSALTGATSNTLTLSGNTLMSTVNGVVATSNAVGSVGNTSSANTLSTTVNGVTGATVPIINTNTNALTQAGGLITTVNGVTATTSIGSGTINKILGFSSTGIPVYQSPGALADSVQDYDWRKAGNLNPGAPADTINNIYHIDGNVGIGTASPAAPLHIFDTGSPEILADRVSANNNAAAIVLRKARDLSAAGGVQTQDVLGLYTVAGSYGNGLYGSSFNSGMAIRATENWTSTAQGSEMLFRNTPNGATAFNYNMGINQNGNVNISADAGTTTPYAKLHVNATNAASGMTAMNGAGMALTGDHFYFENRASATGQRVFSISNTGGVLAFNANSDDASATLPSASLPGAVAIQASNGYVGINVNAPAAQLDVNGTTRIRTLGSSASTDSVVTADATGNLHKRTVNDLINNSGASNNFWNITGNTGTNYTNFLGTMNNVSMRFRTNNVQRMIIDSLGKVGIGTNTPASDLTLYQSAGTAGSSKGFTFTGNSISGNNLGTGFLMSLGYNIPGNKQLWLGDADYAGNVAGSFARFVTTGAVFPVIDAVSGDNSLRRYLAFGVAGDPNSGVIFGGDNTSVNPGSQVWDNGNMSIGSGYKSYAAPTNGLLVQGNVGIGTASPSSALSVIASSNPMYLSGLTALTSFSSSDSVLTISGGIVKKAPNTLFAAGASSSGWLLTGNSNATASSYIGTDATNAQPLIIKSLGRQLASFDGNLYNVALGNGASAGTSDHNVAIGYGATVSSQYAIALGYQASASGAQSATLGYTASATSQFALALGYQAAATGARSIALGNGGTPTASGSESVAIGYGTVSSAAQTIAMGYTAQATNSFNTGIGYDAQSTGLSDAIAIGRATRATQQYSIAIGYNASSTNQFAVAIGSGATTGKDRAIILGNASDNTVSVGIGTNAPNAKLHIVGVAGTNNPLQMTGLPIGIAGTDNILTINSTGIVGYLTPSTFNSNYWSLNGNTVTTAGSFLGTNNTSTVPLQFKSIGVTAGALDGTNTSYGVSSVASAGTNNTAIGNSANAANGSTAIGASTVASAANDVAIGNSAIANGSTLETAIGSGANVNSQEGTALGNNAVVQSGQGTSLGASSKVTAQYGVAVGYKSTSGSGQAIAVGYNSTANGQYSALIGQGSIASAQYSSVIGANTTASGQYSTALGSTAQATNQYNIAVGYGALANNSNQATAIGSTAQATYQNSTALGYSAQAINANQTTAIGAGAQATATQANAVGAGAQATANQTTAEGAGSVASVANASAFGYNAKAQGTSSTAIGYNAQTSQNNTLLLGDATNTNLNIGIGTATPTQKLDIVGNLKFSGALMPNNNPGTTGQFLISTGANNPPVWFDAANYAWQLDGNPVGATRTFGTTTNFDVPFITNNVERMRLTAGGLVGIGVTNPQQALSVGSGLNIDQNNGNTGTVTTALSFGSNSGEGIGSKRSAGGNQFGLDFYTASNNRMIITNSGNIGIGTTSPNNKLEINQGTAGNSGLRFTSLTNTSTPVTNTSTQGGVLSVNSTGDVVLVKDGVNSAVATSSNSGGSNCSTCNNNTYTLSPATAAINVNVGDVIVIEANLMIYVSSGGTNSGNGQGGDFVTIKPQMSGSATVNWSAGASPKSVTNYAPSTNRGPYTVATNGGANTYPGVSPTNYIEYGTVTAAGTLSGTLQGTMTTDDGWAWNNTVLIIKRN